MKSFIQLAYSFLTILIIQAIAVENACLAQQFSRLTAESKYACIKFPSGKYGVGKASSSGYQTRSFSVASKEISTTLSNKRASLQSKVRILNEFAKDNDISKRQLKDISDSQFAFGVKQKLIDKVIKFNLAINRIKGEIALINNELDALRDCQRGKTDFKTVSLAKPSSILARNSTEIILSSLLEIDYPGNYPASFKTFFCIKKDDETRYRLGAGYKNPCSESSLNGIFDQCLAPASKLLLPLYIGRLSSTSSESFIQSSQTDFEKTYSGNYTIKSISRDPNSPCG